MFSHRPTSLESPSLQSSSIPSSVRTVFISLPVVVCGTSGLMMSADMNSIHNLFMEKPDTRARWHNESALIST